MAKIERGLSRDLAKSRTGVKLALAETRGDELEAINQRAVINLPLLAHPLPECSWNRAETFEDSLIHADDVG